MNTDCLTNQSDISMLLLAVFNYLKKCDKEFKNIIDQTISRMTSFAFNGSDKLSVLQINIELNLCELLETSVELGCLVLHDREKARWIFHKVVYEIIKAAQSSPNDIEQSQIHVILRCSNVPLLPGYILDNTTTLSDLVKSGHLVTIRAKITEISAPLQYTQAVCYCCPTELCDGALGFNYVRVHIPGACENNIISHKFSCTVCGSTLVEQQAYRKISDKKIIYVTMDVDDKPQSYVHKLKVMCRDKLATTEFCIGETLYISGWVVYEDVNTKLGNLSMEANWITHPEKSVKSHSDFSHLPQSFKEFYSDRSESPWSFVMALSYLVGECISPAGTFVKLKLALLLSIVSVDGNPLNILCIGMETSLITRLIKYFSTCLPGSTNHSNYNCLFADVKDGSSIAADYLISGGSCLLAHESVCTINDIAALSKSEEHQLVRALEHKNVILPIPNKTDTLQLPVKCRVWAVAESTSCKKKTTRANNKLNPVYLRFFDLVLLTDDYTGEYIEEAAFNSLVLATNPETGGRVERIPHHDLLQYISYVRSIEVDFPECIKAQLANYYLTSRQLRQQDAYKVPTSALRTLLSLAEGFARLSLRSTVISEDALSAILLYEEHLTSISNHSTLAVKPEAHWREDCLSYYLTQQNDHGMRLFETNVQNLCERVSNGSFEE